MEYELLLPAALALLAILGIAYWIRRTVDRPRRRDQQADVYAFVVDALANVLHLPAPEELTDAPDEVRDVVVDAHATLHAAERQLQLHGGRRVLREYRALRDADETGEISPKLVTNLLVEMRRDLGLSVYSELRESPLGFDTDAIQNPQGRTGSIATSVVREKQGADGSAEPSDSNVIASSVRRS